MPFISNFQQQRPTAILTNFLQHISTQTWQRWNAQTNKCSEARFRCNFGITAPTCSFGWIIAEKKLTGCHGSVTTRDIRTKRVNITSTFRRSHACCSRLCLHQPSHVGYVFQIQAPESIIQGTEKRRWLSGSPTSSNWWQGPWKVQCIQIYTCSMY